MRGGLSGFGGLFVEPLRVAEVGGSSSTLFEFPNKLLSSFTVGELSGLSK